MVNEGGELDFVKGGQVGPFVVNVNPRLQHMTVDAKYINTPA